MRYCWYQRVGLVALSAACGGPSEPVRPAPGSAFHATLVGGSPSALVGSDVPVTVQVTDSAGAAVPNQIMSFVVTSGGGHVFAGAALTSTSGGAREIWTLGPPAGKQNPETGARGQSPPAPPAPGRLPGAP